MDAITLLRNDHKTVEQLFKRFEKAGDGAHTEKRQIVDRIIEELSVHASVEEQIFYPVARATVPDTEDVTLESLEEHHVVKWLLSELEGLDPEHERFDAKVTVLIENVRHHVEEEEGEFFPKVRAELGRKALADLGQALEDAKQSAPTRPHPRSPDEPPGNAVVGAIAGVVDNISGIAQGGVSAAQDLIARIMGADRPNGSSTGSSTTRTQAKNVRRTANNAGDGAQRTARSVKSGASKTARAASSGTKATTSSTKKSARTTAATAKRATTTTGRTAKAATKRTAATAGRPAPKKAAAGRSR
jgi:hemerythrin superfamily protein